MHGRYIVIEGGDGAGKDTQIDLLKKDFSGERFVYTREPGSTRLGSVLRDILLHEAQGEVSLMAEFFLFLADRAQHVHEVVLPALDADKVVISHRSWISMMAYQIYGRGQMDMLTLAEDAVDAMYKKCPINLAIILDIAPEAGLARQRAQGKELDTMERVPLSVRAEIRRGYLKIAEHLSCAEIIDANRPVEQVYKEVRAAVAKAIAQE